MAVVSTIAQMALPVAASSHRRRGQADGPGGGQHGAFPAVADVVDDGERERKRGVSGHGEGCKQRVVAQPSALPHGTVYDHDEHKGHGHEQRAAQPVEPKLGRTVAAGPVRADVAQQQVPHHGQQRIIPGERVKPESALP